MNKFFGILASITLFVYHHDLLGDTAKVKLFEIDHSKLLGYSAEANPSGKRHVDVGVFSDNRIYAYIHDLHQEDSSHLPNPQYLTVFNGKGRILSEEKLPLQVNKEDCSLPRMGWANQEWNYFYDVCPRLVYSFDGRPARNNESIVKISQESYRKTTEDPPSWKTSIKTSWYVLKIPGSADRRWTLLGSDKDGSKTMKISGQSNDRKSALYMETDNANNKTIVYKIK
jgi:hypothetical protein